MGVIQQQTIKGAMYSYLGIIIGFFNTVLIMPELLSPEEIGLINILIAISALYAQFSTLGFTSVTSRIFSYFRNKDKDHNGFAFLVVLTGAIGFILALISFFLLKPSIVNRNIDNSPLLVEYIFFLIPLIFFRMFFLLLDGYNKVLYDATTGTFLIDLGYRVGNLLLLGLFFLQWINFYQYVLGYVIIMSIPAIYLAGLLIYRRSFKLKPQLNFISPSLRKEMISLGLYGIIGGLSGVALMSIDKIMINEYFNLSYTGIYSVSFFFGTIILIPNRALTKISSVVVADAWKENNFEKIQDIYRRSSINQLAAGSVLFVLMVVNLHNIFTILPPEYEAGKMVIVYISLGNLLVVSTGVSITILLTSSKYKVHAYLLALLIVLTIIFNLIFIPLMGISGAAIASLITMFIFSVARVWYMKRRMDLFPFHRKHLLLIGLSIVAYGVGQFMPFIHSCLPDLIVRSGVVCIIFGAGMLIFDISEDITQMMWKTLSQFIKCIHRHN